MLTDMPGTARCYRRDPRLVSTNSPAPAAPALTLPSPAGVKWLLACQDGGVISQNCGGRMSTSSFNLARRYLLAFMAASSAQG